MSASATVRVSIYDTTPEIYDALRQVFPEQENTGTRWLVLVTTSGVECTFFASPASSDDRAGDPIPLDDAA